MFLDTLRALYQYKVITRDEYARIVERVFDEQGAEPKGGE
jgi:hypothetical protein